MRRFTFCFGLFLALAFIVGIVGAFQQGDFSHVVKNGVTVLVPSFPIEQASLTNPSVTGLVTSGARIDGSQFGGASSFLAGATLSATGATISGGTISGTTLSGTTTNSGTISGGTLSSVTISSGTLSSAILSNPTITGGLTPNSGFKHQRFGATCSTSATAGTTCTTTYSWTAAFADANYTVVCIGDTITNLPMLEGVTHTASGVTVTIINFSNAAASFAAVDCVAVHD